MHLKYTCILLLSISRWSDFIQITVELFFIDVFVVKLSPKHTFVKHTLIPFESKLDHFEINCFINSSQPNRILRLSFVDFYTNELLFIYATWWRYNGNEFYEYKNWTWKTIYMMNIITAKTSKNLKIKSYRFHCRHCANIKLMFEIFVSYQTVFYIK